MPQVVVGAESLPSGTFPCEFVGVEDTQGRFNDPAWCWRFECYSGEQAGRQCKRTTGTVVAPDNSAGQMVAWILGGPIARGQHLNLDDYAGEHYLVTIVGGQIVKIRPEVVEEVKS